MAGTIIVLLLVAAGAAPDGFALLERRARGRFSVPSTPVVLKVLLAGLGIFVLLVGLWGVIQAARGLRGRGRASWTSRARAVFLIVAVIGLVFWVAGLLIEDEQRSGPRPAGSIAPTPGPVELPSQSRTLGLVLTIVVGLALAGGILALLRLLRPERHLAGEDRTWQALAEEIDAGIADLRSMRDPRAAVIACYARMSRALLASGLRSPSSDTPLERLHRVLAQRRVAEPSARRLTGLFETAKFSDHGVDEDMRTRAIDALLEVRAQLRATADQANGAQAGVAAAAGTAPGGEAQASRTGPGGPPDRLPVGAP